MNVLLRWLNPERTSRRRVIKLSLLGLVVLFVLYPNPALLWRHVARTFSPNVLIEPTNPNLNALDEELSRRLATRGSEPPEPSVVLAATQRLVYQRVPYQYDWENWGCANYFPTVTEVLDRGRSDCKGRAVVAASLLARRGIPARLVSDLSHVWVWTPGGETMSPVRTKSGRKVLAADERGSRVDVLAVVAPSGLLADMPLRIGYAIAVFPLVRVTIIAAAVWLVLLRRRPRWDWALVGAWSIAGAIVCFSVACENIRQASVLGAWAGIMLAVLGIVLARRGLRRATDSVMPG